MDFIPTGGIDSSYDPFSELGLPPDQTSSMGFPADPVSSSPPSGLQTTTAAIQSAPPISTFDSIWNTIKQDSTGILSYAEDEAKNAYGGIKDVGATVYGDIKSGAGTLYDDVSKPISGIISSAYTYIIVAVVVIGGIIYFAGKSGALRVTRAV